MNTPTWAQTEYLKQAIEEFKEIYERKPIQENSGGMLSPHMFYTWFTVKTLKPALIVDSGTYKGQSAWLFKTTCPEAEIISFDVDASQREITCKGVDYVEGDFSQHSWHDIPSKSFGFFDDHQNAYERVQQCSWFGFQHMMFEDNYPSKQGDCYSLKKAFSECGFKSKKSKLQEKAASNAILSKIKTKLKSKLFTQQISDTQQFKTIDIRPNHSDRLQLEKKLEEYIEFPPIYKANQTRWKDDWDDSYPTPEPLIGHINVDEILNSKDIYLRDALSYTWICYCKLKE